MWKKFDKLLVVIAVLAILLLVLALVTLHMYRESKAEEVPPVIPVLLNTLCSENYDSNAGLALFADSFYELRHVEITEDSNLMDDESGVQDVFELMFLGTPEVVASCDIVPLGKDILKVTRFNRDGDMVLPIIGMWYTMRGGRIDTWQLAELVPFSRYDKEHPDAYEEIG